LRKGTIKGIKVGDLWRVREEDLEEFIAQKLQKL
jgi:excisionase family DNA binding protein